jgi:hypothetical protein
MMFHVEPRNTRCACGELLKQIEDNNRGRNPKQEIYTGTDTNFSPALTRSKAAADAGMSKRQKDTALRVASVPDTRCACGAEIGPDRRLRRCRACQAAYMRVYRSRARERRQEQREAQFGDVVQRNLSSLRTA